MRWRSTVPFLIALVVLAAPAHAQPTDDLALDDAALDEDAPEGADASPTEAAEPAAGKSDRALRLDPAEQEGESYLFAGWMLRGMIMPKFLLEAFLASSPRIADWSTGAEFTYRRDGFDIVTSLWWAGYRFSGPVQEKGAPIQDVEWVDSNWSMLLTTVSFLWDTQFTDEWALQYGFEVGLGWLLGKLHRSEGYQNPDGSFGRCAASGNPPNVGGTDPATGTAVPFCEPPRTPPTDPADEDGAHYNVEQRRWAQGGVAPNVLPWVAARLSLRYKPIKQLMTRADLGIGLGVYLGLSASYGF